jgi:hypothetical protein
VAYLEVPMGLFDLLARVLHKRRAEGVALYEGR